MNIQIRKYTIQLSTALLLFSGALQAQTGTGGLYGGEEIRLGTRGCSVGFNVKKTNDVSDDKFMVTAGHCFAVGAVINEVNEGLPDPTQEIGTVIFSPENTWHHPEAPLITPVTTIGTLPAELPSEIYLRMLAPVLAPIHKLLL